MIRWLDFNDTWLAAEWGHPSDNLGAILAVADYLSRSGKRILVRDVLTAMIKAHEIQGVLALENSFNRVGLDHVLLVRVASTAVATTMLGGSREQIINAVSNAWVDGGALRTYRHAPNTGSRKSWAAGDATSRAVRHALFALKGEMGYPSALTAKTWGFQDVLFKGKPLILPQPFGSYVMENVLFKISYPGGVPRADCRRGGDDAAWTNCSEDRPDRARHDRDPGTRRANHRQDRSAGESRRTAITAFNTWSPSRCFSADSMPPIMRTRWQAIRASMRCAQKCGLWRTRFSQRTTMLRISAISAMRCRCFSRTARRVSALQWTIPLGIASVAPRACQCWCESSSPAWRLHFPPKQAEAIKTLFAGNQALAAMPVGDFVAKLVTAS